MKTNLRLLASYALTAALAVTPIAAGAASVNANAHANAGTCLKAFGHLVAPGFIKMNGTSSVSTQCALPPGIARILGAGRPPHATSTPPANPDTTAPSIFLIMSPTGTSTATITWFTNEPSDSQVAYGATTAYDSSTTLNTPLHFFHSVSITGLASSTTYHFAVMSRDAAGNLATSSDKTFTTKPLPDTTAPIISNVMVSGTGSTTTTVSWTTDEPATSKVFFQAGTSLNLATASTSSVGGLSTGHVVGIVGLTASTTYSFATQSTDASGNTSTSAIGTLITAN